MEQYIKKSPLVAEVEDMDMVNITDDEDLESVAEKYAYEKYPSIGVANTEIYNAVKFGAKWQKEQIEIDYIVLSPVEYQKTIERYFKDGMNEQKKQIKENIQSWLDGV